MNKSNLDSRVARHSYQLFTAYRTMFTMLRLTLSNLTHLRTNVLHYSTSWSSNKLVEYTSTVCGQSTKSLATFCSPRNEFIHRPTHILQLKSQQCLLNVYNYSIIYRSFSKGKSKKGGSKVEKPRAPLTDVEMTPIIDVTVIRAQVADVVNQLRNDFNTTLNLRSGIGLDVITVDIDGEKFPLRELATITRSTNNIVRLDFSSVPEATKPAFNAIIDSGMNVNPQQEATMIYLTVPKITREHRERLAKNAKNSVTLAKGKLSKILSTCNRIINDKKNEQGVSSELANRTADNLKYIVALASEECDKMLEAKMRELLE